MPVPNENDEEQKTVNLRIDFINSRNSSIKSKSSILASSKKSTSRKSKSKSKSTSRQSSSVTSKGSLRSARCSTNNNSEDSGSFSEQNEESSSGSYYTDSEESDSSDYLQYFVEVDENVNPKIKEIYNNLEADIDKYQVNDFCTRCGMKFSHSDARPGKCVLCY